MGRYAVCDKRWNFIDEDWPDVGRRLVNFAMGIPVLHRYSLYRSSHFHTFVDDWRMEAIWRDPDLKSDKVFGLVCTAPDFSVFIDDPAPQAVYQFWRSRIVAARWELAGAFVIPVVQFGCDASRFDSTRGVKRHSVLAVRGPARGDDLGAWKAGCEYWRYRIDPDLVLQFGRQAGSSVWKNVQYRPLLPR